MRERRAPPSALALCAAMALAAAAPSTARGSGSARVQAPAAREQGAVAPVPPAPLAADPVLERLVAESLAARPEVAGAEAAARAERQRVPQAGALPDPVLTLGIQNDGFQEIAIGKMETSFWQVMLSQGLPFPGKRGLRNEVARLAADEAGAAVSRSRLSAEADVARAYLDLLLARDRLALLGRLEAIWKKSAELARARYESAEGGQPDLLRAQLEQIRLRQRRLSLEADERTAVERLDRLRGRPLDEPVETTATLRDLAVPLAPDHAAALEDALARSPELERARRASARASASERLALRERWPDLTVQAGIMPRGGFEPMWQAAVSVPLPIWAGRKQGAAAAESASRAEAEARSARAIEEVLRLRVAERLAAQEALAESVRLYRDGLLVLSRATADSTLSQYAVGRVTFASVLEANAGYVSDEEGHLTAVAGALRLAVAGREVSLEAVGGSGGGMGGASVPGAGPAGGVAAAASGGTAGGTKPAAAPASGAVMPSGM